jgi:hypothetical protein
LCVSFSVAATVDLLLFLQGVMLGDATCVLRSHCLSAAALISHHYDLASRWLGGATLPRPDAAVHASVGVRRQIVVAVVADAVMDLP